MKPSTSLPALALAAALGACGGKADGRNAPSQVAAQVNSAEISIHQVNFVLERTPGFQPSQAQAARRQVLEGLIDQELAVQQALEAKLDRNPDILQAIEAARREILFRAYLDRQLAGRTKPTPAAVKQYFDDHPELFSRRKIYRLEEIAFSAPPEIVAMAREWVARGKATADVVNALKARGIEPAVGIAVKPAEQLPLELLPEIARQREREPRLHETGHRVAIITVLATQAEPLSESRAAPLIEQFLAGRQRSDLTRSLMKQLREKANIAYQGEFAAGEPGAPGGAGPR